MGFWKHHLVCFDIIFIIFFENESTSQAITPHKSWAVQDEVPSPCTHRSFSHPRSGLAWSLCHARMRKDHLPFLLDWRFWKSSENLLIILWWLNMLLYNCPINTFKSAVTILPMISHEHLWCLSYGFGTVLKTLQWCVDSLPDQGVWNTLKRVYSFWGRFLMSL